MSYIINLYQNKIALKKIHSEFSGKLYSKRLDVYLEIYELRSDFGKQVRKILTSHNARDTFNENSIYNLRWFLAQVELSMKYELEMFGYASPSTMEDSG